jgi:hypothetical protein
MSPFSKICWSTEISFAEGKNNQMSNNVVVLFLNTRHDSTGGDYTIPPVGQIHAE